MTLAPGTTLGPYEIVAPLGAGGMGEVYKARDTRLDRMVAIKVSKEQFSKRFGREARTVASLNHPHICQLYDVGPDYLVMEYIEGHTLKGPLPMDQALNYAGQICDALDAAHKQNIIHRDLKPGNIIMNKSGIKLLDFGLAKINPIAESTGDVSTASIALTADHKIVGTLQYMAPEQLEGKGADERSDIFAFGAVLYEMVTGKRAFEGASQASVIAAILEREPPSIAELSSPALEEVLRRCLAKDPDQRWQSARDLKYELERIRGGGGSASAPLVVSKPGVLRKPAIWIGAAILLLAIAGTALWLTRFRKQEDRSIAVLPFADMSAERNQAYFSEGLSEELLHWLAKVQGLRVAGRTSSFRFRDSKDDPRVIGKKLNVATILEGSVRRQGSRARISVQLIKASDGFELWSATFDRDLTDIFGVQEEIARAVTGALQLTLLGQKTPAGAKSSNGEAFSNVLQGYYFMHRVNRENLEKAAGYFSAAIKLDPGYANAWVGLSSVRSTQAGQAFIPLKDGYREAREAVERGLAIDPNLPQGYLALGVIQTNYDWDWEGADASYKKALALEPGNAYVQSGAASKAFVLGRLDEAITLYHKSLELDPLNAAAYKDYGLILNYAGKNEEAAASIRKALELAPEMFNAHDRLAIIYLLQGHGQEALAEAEKEQFPPFKMFARSIIHYALGHRKESDADLAKLIELAEKDGPFQIAEVYAYRGEKDKAFEWLERAYTERDGGLSGIKRNPLLKNIEADPRYPELLKKMRLPL